MLKANHFESEGSLTLLLTVNDIPVFSMNFSFVPGKSFGTKNKESILFISGLKGFNNQFSNITLVSKHFYEMSPRVILLKIAECIAVSAGLDTILAINVDKQVSFGKRNFHQTFSNNYDNFWEKLQGVKMDSGYYCFRCPFVYKPIHLVGHKYRKRTENRRKKLEEIFDKSRLIMADYKNTGPAD